MSYRSSRIKNWNKPVYRYLYFWEEKKLTILTQGENKKDAAEGLSIALGFKVKPCDLRRE